MAVTSYSNLRAAGSVLASELPNLTEDGRCVSQPYTDCVEVQNYYIILDHWGFFPVVYPWAGRRGGAAECGAVGGGTMIISYDKKFCTQHILNSCK